MDGGPALTPAGFVESQKKTQLLMDEQRYTYRLKSKNDVQTYWVCSQKTSKTCYARAVTVEMNGQVFIKSLKVNTSNMYLFQSILCAGSCKQKLNQKFITYNRHRT